MLKAEGAIAGGVGPLTSPSMLGSHGAPRRYRRCASSVMSPVGWADCAPVARLPWRREEHERVPFEPRSSSVIQHEALLNLNPRGIEGMKLQTWHYHYPSSSPDIRPFGSPLPCSHQLESCCQMEILENRGVVIAQSLTFFFGARREIQDFQQNYVDLQAPCIPHSGPRSPELKTL